MPCSGLTIGRMVDRSVLEPDEDTGMRQRTRARPKLAAPRGVGGVKSKEVRLGSYRGFIRHDDHAAIIVDAKI